MKRMYISTGFALSHLKYIHFFCQKAEIFHAPFIFHFFKVKTNKYVQFWVIFKPNLGRKEKVLKFSFQCSMKSSMSFERSLCIAIYATRILT